MIGVRRLSNTDMPLARQTRSTAVSRVTGVGG